jgi:hypothetical protein
MQNEKKVFGEDLEVGEENGPLEILRKKHGLNEFERFESIYGTC